MWAEYLLWTIAMYSALGLVFSIYFLLRGAAHLDHAVAGSPLTARLLWLPGCVALWPFLLSKCLKQSHQ